MGRGVVNVSSGYRLPPGRIVRRARDWRLYDQAGDRYVDFWQADGAAFLGHRPGGLARAIKEEIDRGLWSALPTAWDARLGKALQALADRAGVPALTVEDAPVRWRPLLPLGPLVPPEAEAGPLHVTLPFPLTPALDLAEPPRSPVILSGLVMAAGTLLRYLDLPEAEERIALARSLPIPPGYRRKGVYWFPENERDQARHEILRNRALDRRIILPPSPMDPICCPGVLGRRERDTWEDLCADRTD